MPGLFKRSPPLSPKEIIDGIKSKLQNYSKSELALGLLTTRQNEFEDALTGNDNYQTSQQYKRFAKALTSCVSSPAKADIYIMLYHRNLYYPIGITEKLKPDPCEFRLFAGMLASGIALFLASILTLALIPNPVIGGLMMAGSIVLLIPALLYFCAPDSLDVEAKKCEESLLLHLIADLITKGSKKFIQPDAVPLTEFSPSNDGFAMG